MEKIKEELNRRNRQGLLRTLRPIDRRSRGRIWFRGKEYMDFCSNDYLGLSEHPDLKTEIQRAAAEYGSSACASRLLSGDLNIHHRLEDSTARFKHKKAALLFNTGYQANLGVISTLFGPRDCIFLDRLCHASIIDGVRLSGARFFRFHHNDMDHLNRLLSRERKKYRDALIVTETIFSMEGDHAPLKHLVALKERHHCLLMVDEAHATGIFGRRGSGAAEESGVGDSVDFLLGTFSKALAGYGAYFAADAGTIKYLITACRSFIYSTALPPVVAAGNIKSIELIKKEPFRRRRLLENARFFRESLSAGGFDVRGDSQIVSWVIGDVSSTVACARALEKRGCRVLPIRPPTVPADESRLRFSITHHHDPDTLKRVLDDISRLRI